MITVKCKEYYKCEHCLKIYFRKSACIKHEEKCSSNPKNFDACLGCKYCEEMPTSIEVDAGPYASPYTIKSHMFKCTFHDKSMYPYKAAMKRLPERYPDDFGDQVQMPNKCDDYDTPDEIDISFS